MGPDLLWSHFHTGTLPRPKLESIGSSGALCLCREFQVGWFLQILKDGDH